MHLEEMPSVRAAQDAELAPLLEETDAKIVVPLLEETAHVEKRMTETGVVRVRKMVREHEERIETPLLRESVTVERVPINRRVEGDPPQARDEGDTRIIPVFEEILVVEKRLMLVEEIHIRRVATTQNETQTVTLRRDEAVIERDESKASLAP